MKLFEETKLMFIISVIVMRLDEWSGIRDEKKKKKKFSNHLEITIEYSVVEYAAYYPINVLKYIE